MTLYRRKGSKVFQYDFWKNGKRFQGTTGVKNRKAAEDIENTLKTDIAKAKFGLAPPKQSPPLAEFLEGKFLDHVDQHAKVPSTAKAYRERVGRLLKWPRWRDMPLSQITGDVVNGFIAFRSVNGSPHKAGTASKAIPTRTAISPDMIGAVMPARAKISISALNAELATLRKALNLAEEWGMCPRIKVRLLPGARGRDFVVSPQLEAEYLEAATYPLKQVAILMLDLGLRPEECVRLCKADIATEVVSVRQGKTKNAIRSLPLSHRAAAVIQLLSALFPDSPFLFKGYKDGHLSPKYITMLHEDLRDEKGWPREFCLYNFRHTAITRLVEAGAGVYEVQKFAGHADIKMSARYVHISNEHLAVAVRRMEELGKIMRGEVNQTSHSDLHQTGMTEEAKSGKRRES